MNTLKATVDEKSPIEQIISIPEIGIEHVAITIKSVTPLLMHSWSEKARRAMRDKQGMVAAPKRAAKVPEQECEEATYFIGKGRYGMPATAMKNAMVDAAMSLGMKKAVVRRAFHIVADATTKDGDMVEVLTPRPPVMREDMVRVGMGQADMRYRPEFKEWGMRLVIRFDRKQISVSQLTNLVNKAGFSVGIGEWRVERDGSYGQFTVAGIEGVEAGE